MAHSGVLLTAGVLLMVLVLRARGSEQVSGATGGKPIAWSTQFVGLAATKNLKFDCVHNGQPICCALVSDEAAEVKAKPRTEKDSIVLTSTPCTITKVYIPSEYETKHLHIALQLSLIEDDVARKEKLVQYIRADVDDSNIWLERIYQRMQSGDELPPTPEDIKYLSRFQITKTCIGVRSHSNSTWEEWIEPLTIHARHPFALKVCPGTYTPEDIAKQKFPAQLQSADHVLVQSGENLHEASTIFKHDYVNTLPRHRTGMHRNTHQETFHYLIDAGTSTFESSLRWFLCAYLQVMGVFA